MQVMPSKQVQVQSVTLVRTTLAALGALAAFVALVQQVCDWLVKRGGGVQRIGSTGSLCGTGGTGQCSRLGCGEGKGRVT